MSTAVVTQVIGDLGSNLHHLMAVLVLAVECAKWVQIGTMVALFTQLFRMLVDVLAYHFTVSRTTLLAAHRVQKQASF